MATTLQKGGFSASVEAIGLPRLAYARLGLPPDERVLAPIEYYRRTRRVSVAKWARVGDDAKTVADVTLDVVPVTPKADNQTSEFRITWKGKPFLNEENYWEAMVRYRGKKKLVPVKISKSKIICK